MSVKCRECGCALEVHSEDSAALMPCVGCQNCHGFRFPKYKWEDAGKREWFELITEAMQYHWHPKFYRGYNGTDPAYWEGEVLQIRNKQRTWISVGKFKYAGEAKAAVIAAYEKQTLESASADDFNSSAS